MPQPSRLTGDRPEQLAEDAPIIVARFSEITLKGRNRSQFEKRMAENAVIHLKDHGQFRVKREPARLTVSGEEDPRRRSGGRAPA